MYFNFIYSLLRFIIICTLYHYLNKKLAKKYMFCFGKSPSVNLYVHTLRANINPMFDNLSASSSEKINDAYIFCVIVGERSIGLFSYLNQALYVWQGNLLVIHYHNSRLDN